MFLATDELENMTEASKRPLQEAWLTKNRVPYTKGRKGKLNVLRAYIERLHGLKDIQTPGQEPDINVFRQGAEAHGQTTKQSRRSA